MRGCDVGAILSTAHDWYFCLASNGAIAFASDFPPSNSRPQSCSRCRHGQIAVNSSISATVVGGVGYESVTLP